MPIHGVFLLQLIVQICSHVTVGVRHGLNISLDSIEVLLFVSDANIGGTHVGSQISVAGFGTFDMLAQVIAVGTDTVDVFPESADLHTS